MVGNFAKVLLLRGGQKDVPKCTRVDSLGLAKRRLQKQHEQELVLEEPDADGELPAARCRSLLVTAAASGAAGRAANRTSAPGYDAPGRDDDEDEGNLTPLAHRQLNDSIGLARARIRAQHNEIEAAPSGAERHKRASGAGDAWDARPPADQDEEAAESAGLRFRRASDGEYLSQQQQQHKGSEGSSRPSKNALKRLFRKLITSPIEDLLLQAGHHHHHTPSRPRSATHSRGGSPNRLPSAGRVSSTGPSSSRRRSMDTAPDRGPSPASPATRARAGPSERRSKRQSAPGELFFSTPAGGGGGGPAGGAHDAATPPCAHRPRSAVSVAAREPSGKSRNWLSRLSIGLGGAASKPTAAAPPAASASAPLPQGSPSYRGPMAAAAAPPPEAAEHVGGRPPRHAGAESGPQPAVVAGDEGAGAEAEASLGGPGRQQSGLPPVPGAVATPAGSAGGLAASPDHASA